MKKVSLFIIIEDVQQFIGHCLIPSQLKNDNQTLFFRYEVVYKNGGVYFDTDSHRLALHFVALLQ